MAERKMIYLDDAINALERKKDKKANGDIGGFYNKIIQNDIDTLMQLPPAQLEITKEYNLKQIYNIYVKIAQAHFVYQPSKPKTITAMPFDWIEAQNLLEKYLEDHGADFDALCREYVSENVKDDLLPPAQLEQPTGAQDILQYLDEYLHPIVSPEHWSVYSELYDMVSMLPSAQPEPHWVPCSETVDIPDHEVLACDKRGEMIIGYLEDPDDQWLCESETEILYDPVAWMEKPEPYAERRQDE